MNPIEVIKQRSMQFMDEHSFSGHDFEHVMRVYKLAKTIGEEENADMLILEAAALMHDLGRHAELKNPKLDHAGGVCKDRLRHLKKHSFPDDKVQDVLHAIRAHRFSKGEIPFTTEAKVLQDADRLDALGAIGIARCFAYTGAVDRMLYDPTDPICKMKMKNDSAKACAENLDFEGSKLDDKKYGVDHFHKKLFTLKDTLHTNSAKKIAENRDKYMRNFLEKLEKEIDGKE